MKISKGTLVRTIMIVLVIVNMALQHFGYDIIDVEESTILALVEILIEIAVIVVGFWKNNSYSENAIKADEFLKKLKYSTNEELEHEGVDL